MTNDPAAELLDRQLNFLEGLPDVDFLLSIAPFLTALDGQPELSAHLAELEHEADELGRLLRREELDGAPDATLRQIWDDLHARLAASMRADLLSVDPRFEQLAAAAAGPVVLDLDPVPSGEDDSRVGQMIKLIDRFDVSGGWEAIGRNRAQFRALRARQERLRRWTLHKTRVSAGVALLRLRCLAQLDQLKLNGAMAPVVESRPHGREELPALVIRADGASRRWAGLFEMRVLFDETGAQREPAADLVASLRVAVRRVGAELRARVGTTRSRLATIDRFSARCQLHDRRRLAALTDGAPAPEGVLRDELALFLFDSGLNPITEVSLGVTRADLLERDIRGGFLLEAKQYADSSRSSIEAALRRAFAQALDTAGRLPGSGHDVEEAFVVLFRRGGPRAILPAEPIAVDGRRWYLRLIDIADPDASGSRNRTVPAEFTTATLRALLVEERSAARGQATAGATPAGGASTGSPNASPAGGTRP